MDGEIANIPFMTALAGALRCCKTLMWLATCRVLRLALHPASNRHKWDIGNSSIPKGQEGCKKWFVVVELQPMFRKSDSLLGQRALLVRHWRFG